MDTEPIYLTKEEVAERARVSVRTVEREIERGHLRAGGSRGAVRIRPEWVDNWLDGEGDERGADDSGGGV